MSGMGVFRMIVRTTLLVPWTIAWFLLRLCTEWLSWVTPQTEHALWRLIFQSWARGVLFIIGAQIEVRGPRPPRPFFLVSNHLTYLDVIILAREVGCIFISKAEVMKWPVIGFIVRHMKTLFIDREQPSDTRRVNSLIEDALRNGYDIHVFAEGGVSPAGELKPFKSALFEPAIATGMAVYYAAIEYHTLPGSPPASEVVIWRTGVTFIGNMMNILQLPGLTAVITFGNQPIKDTERKQLAERLHKAVLLLQHSQN